MSAPVLTPCSPGVGSLVLTKPSASRRRKQGFRVGQRLARWVGYLPYAALDDFDDVAGTRAGARYFARGELYHRKRPERSGDPARPHRLRHLQHASVASREQDVYRESHSKCMHQVGWSDDQGVSGRQTVASEEATFSVGGTESRFNMRRNRQTAAEVPEHERAI